MDFTRKPESQSVCYLVCILSPSLVKFNILKVPDF